MAQEYFVKTVDGNPADAFGNAVSNSAAVALKLDKVTTVDVEKVYIKNADGTQGIKPLSELDGIVTKSYVDTADALKINKASNVEGQILRSNGTEFVPISEVEFMRNKEAFAKSFLSTQSTLHGLIQFDSFYGKSDGSIPVSNGGGTWINYVGSPFRVRDQRLQLSTLSGGNPLSPSINGLPLLPKNQVFNRGNYFVDVNFSSATSISFLFFNNLTNYLEIRFSVARFEVYKIVAGIATQILSGVLIPTQYRNSISSNILNAKIYLNSNFTSGTAANCSLKVDFEAFPLAGFILEDVAITNAVNEIFPDANDINAFCIAVTPNTSPLTRFQLINSLSIFDNYNGARIL
jgi:hypothetical protein